MSYSWFFFFFKQRTAYEMRISDWSSDVCSSDLLDERLEHFEQLADILEMEPGGRLVEDVERLPGRTPRQFLGELDALCLAARQRRRLLPDLDIATAHADEPRHLLADRRSAEHTSELQSPMRIPYAVFGLKNNNIT